MDFEGGNGGDIGCEWVGQERKMLEGSFFIFFYCIYILLMVIYR